MKLLEKWSSKMIGSFYSPNVGWSMEVFMDFEVAPQLKRMGYSVIISKALFNLSTAALLWNECLLQSTSQPYSYWMDMLMLAYCVWIFPAL